ncbi:alcohol dehydrogenase [Nitrospira sp.]|nr:alcohol dehydrogenase [Nitrospira sp.]
MAKMTAVQLSKPGEEWELVEREIPDPGPGMVRIRVEACGICHSDVFVKDGLWPGLQYPRVPGHEVAGHIDAVGPNVAQWTVGARVGVGWHGGHCGHCDRCLRGDFLTCRVAKISGITVDGGWGEYMVAPANVVAAIPEGIALIEAAPLLCAGITTFNSLRNSGAKPGDLVAVHGIGGLGHLGIQYANKMGFSTIAVNRGSDKETLARKLGAHHYIDATAVDPAEELQRLGGARVILATAPDATSISSLVNGLGVNGRLLVVAAPGEPLSVNVLTLIGKRASVQGWPSGTAKDSEDAVRFSTMTGIRPMIEPYPLAKAAEAYRQMLSGKARFRVVLRMGS